MNTHDVIMVRIYTTESSSNTSNIIKFIKEESTVRGFSIFRAVSGFGDSGDHTASFLDISLDLPLVIEFFDKKETITKVIEHLSTMIKTEHMVFWTAQTNA